MAQSYYVLEKFAEADRGLVSLIEAMPIKRRAIDIYRKKNQLSDARSVYSELAGLQNELTEIIQNLQLLFSECEMWECAAYAAQLYNAVKQFNLLTADYTKFIGAVQKLKAEIPRAETADAKVIGHLMNNVKMGYYPTDIAHVNRIKQALCFPEENVNLLDPCCGCGLALEMLAMEKNAVTYGIEIDESRGKEAEGRLNRVGYGSFFHSKLANEAFHAVFLNPPYLNVMGEGGTRARHEKRFLVESLHCLMQNGILIYIIPYYRLTNDICRVLCDNFQDISVYRFMDGEFAKYKQIVVFGVKKKKEDGSKQAEILSQYAMQPEKIPAIDKLGTECYAIPGVAKAVDLFKGAVFNLGELGRQLAASKSVSMLFEKSRIDALEKRPLLPLSIGQVGLIGGSGLINGYIDCDEPHIIKGRVVKETSNRDNADSTVSEIKVNRMLFNILTPDGVKRLA